MSFRIRFLSFVCILSFFVLFFLTRLVLADGMSCGCIERDWSANTNMPESCEVYSTAAARDAAFYSAYSSGQCSFSTYSENTPAGSYKACFRRRVRTAGPPVIYEYPVDIFAHCSSCPEGMAPDANGKCSYPNCFSERAAAEAECGGPDSYDIDETWCVFQCKNLCREKARDACHDQPMSGSSDGPYDPMSNTKGWDDSSGMCKYECRCPNYDGSIPYNQYDFETCQRIPSDTQCQAKFEEDRKKCPFGELSTANYETCESTCETCSTRSVECQAKCPDTGGKLYDCDNYLKEEGWCICADQDCSQMREVCETNCRGRGGVGSYNCAADDYTCICKYDVGDCNTFKQQCAEQCSSKGGVKEDTCFEIDGKIREAFCDCVEGSSIPTLPPISDSLPQTCADLQAKCNASCMFACTSGPDGYAKTHRCDCSSPSDSPDDGGDDESSDDPADEGDGNGWLRSIKENTDTFVGQGNDIKGWLSSLKGNSDKSLGMDSQRNEYLDSISENAERIVSNQAVMDRNAAQYSKNEVDAVNYLEKDVERTNELIGGKNGTNELISGVNKNLDENGAILSGIKEGVGVSNQKLDGIGGTLTDIKGMLSGSSSIDISTGTYTGDEMSEGGYGEAPTDADLPTAAATDAAFGTFATEGDGGYRNQISSALGGLSLPVSSPECSLVWTIPSSVPRLGGHSYHLNFCDYASLLASIGSVLVFMAAAYQLYLFS